MLKWGLPGGGAGGSNLLKSRADPCYVYYPRVTYTREPKSENKQSTQGCADAFLMRN